MDRKRYRRAAPHGVKEKARELEIIDSAIEMMDGLMDVMKRHYEADEPGNETYRWVVWRGRQLVTSTLREYKQTLENCVIYPRLRPHSHEIPLSKLRDE